MVTDGTGAVLTPPSSLAVGGKACYDCKHWGEPFKDELTYSLYNLGPVSTVNNWSNCTCPSFPAYYKKQLEKDPDNKDFKTKTRKIRGPVNNLYLTNQSYSCPYMRFKISEDSSGEDRK